MDAIYWRQAYATATPCSASLGDPRTRRYAEINYGPWDRLDGNAPFVAGRRGASPRAPASTRAT